MFCSKQSGSCMLLLWFNHSSVYLMCNTIGLIFDYSGSKEKVSQLYPPVALCWRLKCRHTQADVSQQPTRLVNQGF
jgi:hypothetical protein